MRDAQTNLSSPDAEGTALQSLRPALQTAKLGLPAGWYFVGPSATVPTGKVVIRTLFEREILLYRTQGGTFAASDPHCPHLGAHLGHCGEVRGESLRCPFHGFAFDVTGECVATGYGGKLPPAAQLRTWPTEERWGLLFVWLDEARRAPWFSLPDFDMTGWPPFLLHTTSLHSHPQEISENAVDAGHFTVLHGYSAVTMRADIEIEGPTLTAHYALKRAADFLGKSDQFFESEFDARLYGLGVNHIHAEADNFGLATRILVLQTPTGTGQIDLTLAITVLLREPRRLHPLAALLPRSLSHWLIQRGAMWGFKRDVSQDLVMWEKKAFLPRPALASGDGPIGRYRAWCRQFYPPTPEPPPGE